MQQLTIKSPGRIISLRPCSNTAAPNLQLLLHRSRDLARNMFCDLGKNAPLRLGEVQQHPDINQRQ